MSRRVLLVLLLAAFLLRLPLISLHNFTADEALSYFLGKLSAGDVLLANHYDRHPPFSYLMFWALVHLTHSEVGIRLPFMLMAIGTIYCTYELALLLSGAAPVAGIAALLQATLFTAWHNDCTAHMYEPARLGTLAASYLLARMLLAPRPPRGAAPAFAVLTSVAIGFHYFAGVLAMAQGWLAVRFTARDNSRRPALLGAAAAIAVLCLPLAWLLHLQMHSGVHEMRNASFIVSASALLYPYYLGLTAAYMTTQHAVATQPAVLWCSALVTVAMLAWQAAAWRAWRLEQPDAARFIGTLLGVYLVFLFVVCPLGSINVRNRYLYLVYPYVSILLAWSLCRLRSRTVGHGIVAAICVLNLALAVNYLSDPWLWDYDMQPLAQRVRTRAGPNDLLMLYQRSTEMLLFEYYYDREVEPFTRYGDNFFLAEPSEQPDAAAYRARGGIPQYFVRGMDGLTRDMPRLRQHDVIWFCTSTLQDSDFHDQGAILRLLDVDYEREEFGFTTADDTGGPVTWVLFKCHRRP